MQLAVAGLVALAADLIHPTAAAASPGTSAPEHRDRARARASRPLPVSANLTLSAPGAIMAQMACRTAVECPNFPPVPIFHHFPLEALRAAGLPGPGRCAKGVQLFHRHRKTEDGAEGGSGYVAGGRPASQLQG
jgi:hypothetical protein